MKYLLRLICILSITSSGIALVEGQTDAATLMNDGALLNKTGRYAEAASKYDEALKIEPQNPPANYGMAVALNGEGQGYTAIPYLQKIIAGGSAPWVSSAYKLMGSIYDNAHDAAKAIEAYNAALKIDPADQSLYFDLGLVYFRDKRYAEAEKYVVQSLKMNPNNVASHRMYALVCFHQNKRANALLGFCSVIVLDPDGSHAVESYGNIEHILQGGTLKAEAGVLPIVADANTVALNDVITKTVADSSNHKDNYAADMLAARLSGIFKAIYILANKQGDIFFRQCYVDCFYKLAQSPNMPAFARLLSRSTPESSQWIKNNLAAMKALEDWSKSEMVDRLPFEIRADDTNTQH